MKHPILSATALVALGVLVWAGVAFAVSCAKIELGAVYDTDVPIVDEGIPSLPVYAHYNEITYTNTDEDNDVTVFVGGEQSLCVNISTLHVKTSTSSYSSILGGSQNYDIPKGESLTFYLRSAPTDEEQYGSAVISIGKANEMKRYHSWMTCELEE